MIRNIAALGFACILFTGCASESVESSVPATTPHSSQTSNYSILFEFKNGDDGYSPKAPPIFAHGQLYGTTFASTNGKGAVYGLVLTGQEHLLHDFSGGSDGGYPGAGLVDVGKRIYGTTEGGIGLPGTVFSADLSGKKYRILHRFSASGDGLQPEAPLIESNGVLYGTTWGGGAKNDGTIFSVRIADGQEQVLHSFSAGSDGAFPHGGLINVRGVFYGMTASGGLFQSGGGAGTIYTITPAGAYRVIFTFDIADGEFPYGELTEFNKVLYGTTTGGGTTNYGTVFSVNLDGSNEQVLHNFAKDGHDGYVPAYGLTLLHKTLYGTASGGGAYGGGILFIIDPVTRSETILHNFGYAADGSTPIGTVALPSALYGATESGFGYSAGGTIFTLTP